ncbi:MAG: YhbY family RNA-binding protein [Candidatus Altiarchaeia archaeon]|jgi:RNA-binding protein
MEKTEPVEEVMVVQLGKAGITASFIEEVRDQVKKKKTVKVKILRSAKGVKDRKEIAEEVAKKCNAVLADVRGNTFVLNKR